MSSIGQGSISIDESTRIGENAQDTANKVAGNVNDINSDNKLTPSEKIKLKQEYDKDLKIYTIDTSQLQSADLPTMELETAMSNLTAFITPLFKEMNSTSNVDRNALDGVFTAFATADKNASQSFVNKVQQVADDAKKAGDDAKEAGEKAQEAGEAAKQAASQAQTDATQAKSDAATAQQKAQSSIDQLNEASAKFDGEITNVKNSAQKALDNITVVDSKVDKLSTSTTAQFNTLKNGYQEVISTVDNMEIGGRNYLLATSTPFTKVLDATNNDLFDYSYYYSFGAFKGSSFKTGMKVMWSYDWEVSNMTAYGKFNAFIESSPFTVDKAIGTDSEKGLQVIPSATNTSGHVEIYATLNGDIQNNTSTRLKYGVLKPFKGTLTFKNMQFVVGNKATDWSPAPEDLATSTEFDQLNNAIKLKTDSADVTSQITESINNINLKVANANGSSSQVNINDNTILLDANKIIFSGNTSILDGTIGTAKIANAAINTAQIADGAINNAKIAYAAIDDAKISNLNGNKLIENSITANKINVDDLIANGINTKTLTSVNLNTSTLTTPKLDLGLNGTFTEDFNYTQPTSFFLPKKNMGTLTFNHGVLQSKGTMQTYVNGQWGGMNDQLTFQAGTNNTQWTELAPGYIKMDLCKTDGSAGQRIYADPTGYYYTSAKGDKSYLGNILQTGQVQSGSILGKYIGPMDGQLRLQIGQNGNHYGLQVGSYAGQEAVLSDFIYSSTVSYSPDVHINSNGHLVRSTSASKYKYNIKNPDIETTLGDRLLNVHLATWNDKRAVDSYAEQLNTGKESEKSSIDKFYGLIAEQLRDAGLDMFITYGKNHEIEGIQYDRAWVPLLSVIRRLNDKVNEYELRLSKLEGASK